MSTQPILGYWAIRGLAQPIRLLLTHAGAKFEDVQYVQGDGPTFNVEQWTSKKHTLGLPFPNLPYYIDGDHKITQSNAILRYIARKYDLLGKTEEEKVNVDVMLEQSMDFRNSIVGLVYNSDYEKLKDEFYKNLPAKLKAFETFLGKRQFFAGENVTVCDFPMYELLDQLRTMKSDVLDGFQGLKSFLDRFEALPEIKKYLADPKHKPPMNNKSAKIR